MPRHEAELAFGQRLADRIAAAVGSWPFLVGQTVLLTAWVWGNTTGAWRFDRPPFILLNLLLSFQAAYSTPIILMSQNRQSAKDRQLAESTFHLSQQMEALLAVIREQVTQIEVAEERLVADFEEGRQ